MVRLEKKEVYPLPMTVVKHKCHWGRLVCNTLVFHLGMMYTELFFRPPKFAGLEEKVVAGKWDQPKVILLKPRLVTFTESLIHLRGQINHCLKIKWSHVVLEKLY